MNTCVRLKPTASVRQALVTVLLVTAAPASALAGATPMVAVHAINLSPGEVTYSVRVTNPTDAAYADITLHLRVPGAIIEEVLTAPAGAAVTQGHGTIAWAFKTMAPRTITGPFACRVRLQGAFTPAQAVLQWTLPTMGTIRTRSTSVESALSGEVTAVLNKIPLTSIRGTAFAFSMEDGPLYTAPLGPAGSSPDGVLGRIPSAGIRYFVPGGDVGQVAISRLHGEPPVGTADGLAWVAAFWITKARPRTAIFEVPIARPAPPYSLVRVFVDSGDGFHEQPTLGTITGDGLHATFASEGNSVYALGVDANQLTRGVVDLGPAGMTRMGIDPTEGVSSMFQESYSEVFGVSQMANAFMGLLIGQTLGGSDQQPSDFDGDGLTNLQERQLGTDPEDPDSDNDGMSDGRESDNGTDPNDNDTDDDGLGDGVEDSLGTNPKNPDTDGDAFPDGEEHGADSDPLDPDDTPLDFAPVPGCGGWGVCFSFGDGGTLFYLTDVALQPSLEGLLGIPTDSPALLPRGTSPGLTSELAATDLRAIVGIFGDDQGDRLFLVIPAGQRVGVTLGRPLVKGGGI